MITTSIKTFQDLEDIKSWLLERNNEYRFGNPTVTDEQYDEVWRKYKDLTSEQLSDGTVQYLKVENKRVQCPIPLTGLNKMTEPSEFLDWIEKNNLWGQEIILTPKYDGMSCGVDNTKAVNERKEKNVYVKGEDNMAFSISHHFAHVQQGHKETDGYYHIGEIIIPTTIFNQKYSQQYKNVRNFVAGKMNPNSQSTPELKDFVFMRYNLENNNLKMNKDEMLDYLNTFNEVRVPYITIVPQKDFTVQDAENLMKRLYNNWIKDFEIDGIVADVNNYLLRQALGRDTVGNPKYAVALKFDFISQKATVKIKEIKFFIDKDGTLNPNITTDIVYIDGASIGNNIFIDNIKYMKDNGIYNGKTVEIKRSGKIIPRISRPTVIDGDITSFSSYKEMVEKEILPQYCPYCGEKLRYDENSVSVVCPNEFCQGRKFRELLFFFETIKAKGISSATLDKIVNNLDINYFFSNFNYDRISYIISVGEDDQIYNDFGIVQKKNIVESIHKALAECPIERLMAASNAFSGLGETKLKWIINKYSITYDNCIDKFVDLTLDDIKSIEGYSDITAKIFIDNIKDFILFYSNIYNILERYWKEYKKLDATIIVDPETNINLAGQNFCFTGFRNIEAEKLIVAYGGIVKNSFTNATTVLVVKEKGLGTVKEKKALTKGIKIMDEIDLREMLGMKTIVQEQQDKTSTENSLW